MRSEIAARVRSNPHYLELVAKRRRFSWTITAVMLVVYFGFILVVAFDKALLGTRVGGVITLAFPVGLAIIVLAIALTGIYVLRANGEFDRLTRLVADDAR